MRTLTMLCLLCIAGSACPQVVAAAKDAADQPVHLRPYLRYLSLANLEPDTREDAYRVLCGHCCHLATTPDIVRPVIVPGTAGALLRINLKDYGWSASVWEKLADADPYFHLRVTTVVTEDWPGGVWSDGKYYAAGSFRVKRSKTRNTLYAGREEPQALAALAKTVSSEAPILYADWWFNQTAIQTDRVAGYYDFLGVKDEKGFQRLIGFDAKLAERFGNDVRASVGDSAVTLQPRAIVRQATLGGGYWRTFDFKKAVGDNNPLKVLGKDIEKGADATEQYGHLPNGFFATGLFDKAGKRQDTAPDFIASDGASKSTDRRVHINLSCVRCHAASGLQPIDDWTRNLLQPPLSAQSAQSKDYEKLIRIRREYLRSLEPFLRRDREIFADAVKEATGWTVKEYSARYAAFWERYEDAKVDIFWAARSLGVHAADLHYAVQVQAAAGQGDPVLSVFLVRGLRQRTIGIRQWEELYPQAQVLMKGVKK